MKIIRLDRTGHTELEVPVEEAIQEVERAMNAAGGAKVCSVLVEEPGKVAERITNLSDLATRDPESQVWILPQLVGG